MIALVIYMAKVAIYLIAFYIVYSLMLSRDTSYGRNRTYILVTLTAALLFPLISFQTGKPHDIQFFGKFLSEVFIRPASFETESLNSGSSLADPLQIVCSVYVLGVFVSVSKLIADILNLFLLIARQKTNGSRIIRFHGFNTSGFSAMGYIFINIRLSREETREIIRHEQNHLRQNHFIDIIYIELVKAIQWFNPVIHLFNRSLRAIHEYQADHDCLSSGIPVVNYQSLLLSQVFKTKTFNLANSFSNPSLIKKRMIMMTKKPTSAIASLKLLLVIPVTALVFLAISAYKEIPNPVDQQIIPPEVPQISSQPQITQSQSATSTPQTKSENVVPPPPPPPQQSEEVTEEPEPFVVVEEMPRFHGGDTELLKYIQDHTVYPEVAKENNIQGKVVVRFCVTAKGGVSQVSILKSVSPDLDKEAVRVVNTLPSFEAGRQGGTPVPVWFTVPINFALI